MRVSWKKTARPSPCRGLTHPEGMLGNATAFSNYVNATRFVFLLLTALSDQIVDDATVDIGQAKISTGVAVGQSLVVKA